ncbi:response regulator transcription factor [Cupriavidus sp. YAF13]|uniref:response regulator transcription factor n=1 Tax=Cupriavidus sp. YAF13 TaxID=3233075 RepID=UPI003F927E7D
MNVNEEHGLSERQGEVLEMLLDGASNKHIARRLGITENAAKGDVSAIFTRLGVPNRIHLFARLREYSANPGLQRAAPNVTAKAREAQLQGSTQMIQVTPADLGLTPRQGTVLALLLEGHSNKAIARQLGLAEYTVKEYPSTLFRGKVCAGERGRWLK